MSYTPDAVLVGRRVGHGGRRRCEEGAASVIDVPAVLGGQLTRPRRYGCGLSHWMHQQCYHLRVDQAEEQMEKESASGGHWLLTGMSVDGGYVT